MDATLNGESPVQHEGLLKAIAALNALEIEDAANLAEAEMREEDCCGCGCGCG